MLAIIGGSSERFAPFSQLFQQALERFGRAPLPVGVHSPGHVAATDEQAREEFWPRYKEVITRVSKTRGFAVPTKESFLHEVDPRGALRRVAGNGRAEDRGEPHPPRRDTVRLEIRHGGSRASSPHDEHRALRYAGHPSCPRTTRVTGTTGVTASRKSRSSQSHLVVRRPAPERRGGGVRGSEEPQEVFVRVSRLTDLAVRQDEFA